MGRKSREKPARLAEKLLQIRQDLGLSQSQMLRLIRGDKEDGSYRHLISEYESGKRAPSLLEVLAYARAAKVSMDVLVDDTLDLIEQPHGNPKRGGKDTRRRVIKRNERVYRGQTIV